MNEQKIARINELAKKQREQGLTEEEAREQQELRKEYIASVRRNLEAQLGSIVVQEEDGSRHKLEKKND